MFAGAIDPHTHVFGAIATDTMAAICGGATTVISLLPHERGEDALETARRLVANEISISVIDIGMHAVVWESTCFEPSQIADLAQFGITSIKLWFAYRDLGIMVEDDQALAILCEAARQGTLALAHCENGPLADALRDRFVAAGNTNVRFFAEARPIELEAEAVHRFLAIATLAGVEPYVVHVTGRRSLEEIALARSRGQSVYADGPTCRARKL